MKRLLLALALAVSTIAAIGTPPVSAERSEAPPGAARETAARLANGAVNTCIILDNEQVRCWGSLSATGVPDSGNIGDDETPDQVRTVDVGPGRTVKEVGVGENFACVILDNGDVRCWGYQTLGPTLGVPESNGARIGDNEEPTSIPTTNVGGKAVAIATSYRGGCVILESGDVQCWGSNDGGQVGTGDNGPSGDTLRDIGDDETPASVGPVDLGPGNTATAIAGGRLHNCAILQTGEVRCWGAKEAMPGQVEDIGDNESVASVPVVDLDGEKAVAISAGSRATCALTDDDSIWCWGQGTASRNATGGNSNNVQPDKMDLGGNVPVSVTVGFDHACFVNDVGQLFCWGDGDDGRLGYGNEDDVGGGTVGDPGSPLTGGPVDVGAGRTVLAASAGSTTTCALLDNLTVRCWGQGGIIGTGTTDNVGDDELPGSVPVVNYVGTAAFTPLSPARILDTRPGMMAPAGSPKGIVPPGGTIDVQITGEGGVPETGVYAVVLNVAMASPTNFGFVTAYPTGSGRPNAANLNVQDGNASNSVIVPVGDDGRVSLFSTGGGHLVADVFGYFEQTGSSTSGRLVGVAPSRIFDTRPGSPQPGPKGAIPRGGTIEVRVTDTNGVPGAGVSAVVLNVTAVRANGNGFVTVWPGDEAQPTTANINVSTRTLTRPNTVIMPVSDTGTIKLFTSSGAHLVADVFAYFTDDTAADTDDGLFVPISPTRLFDSRQVGPPLPADGQTSFAVTGRFGIPTTANAVVLNLAAIQGQQGYITGWPADQARPDTASLNAPGPDTNISNLAILPLSLPSGQISVYSEKGAHVAADTAGYFI
ncbi:MAG: RCC1 domain-containing protein [Ilumatobacter sp.]|uniref:RCC1 domain-containing protein n=1 Tax=Ilumatobacter sp. TaxID=1967498 RepID=UPI00391951B2